MTQKEMVTETVRELPDDCSLDEIADRIEFLAAVQKGLSSARPRRRHSPRRDQETIGVMANKLIWSPASRDDLRDILSFNGDCKI
jgi:hypothetical protein